jgi:predicted DNA-binding ribbon-helix-helix protein
MKSHSIVIDGHKTSVSLEDAFWNGLREIAKRRHQTSAQLVAIIKGDRQHGTVASAIRLFVLGFYREHRKQDVAHGLGARASSNFKGLSDSIPRPIA